MVEAHEAVVEHFGVKGMKWGVRKNRSTVDLVSDKTGARTTIKYDPTKAKVTQGPDGRPSIVGSKSEVRKIQKQIDRHPSDDAARAAMAARKAKRGGTHSLSNKELQDLVTRMNLEKQFNSLRPPSTGQKAAKFIGEIVVQVGKQQVTKLANDALSKEVAKMMAGAKK